MSAAMVTYPSWAPASLVSHYEGKLGRPQEVETPESLLERFGLLSREQEMQVLHALLTDERMRSVWQTLARRADAFERAQREEHPRRRDIPWSQEVRLYHKIKSSLGLWKRVPKLTPAELAQKYKDVAEAAERLYVLIEETKDRALVHLASLVGEERLKELAEELGYDGDAHDGYALWLIKEAIGDFDSLLITVMERAQRRATDPPGTVSQPNSPRAPLRFFVERMSDYFQKYYGTPLDETVATIASVVFSEDVDRDLVRARRNGKIPH